MKLTGAMFFVRDLGVTKTFYEKLGFKTWVFREDFLELGFGEAENDDEFHLEFVPDSNESPHDEEFAAERQLPRGGGQYLYIQVESVDELHRSLQGQGITPSSEPRDWPWGQREFALRDPDGYKLIFWQKS